MALSGVTTFNPDLNDIVDEAYQQAGIEVLTGHDHRSAVTSMNLILVEWANKGHNLWTVDEEVSSLLTLGTAEYDITTDTTSVITVKLRENGGTDSQLDLNMRRMSVEEYANLPNKNLRGRPLQYWIQMKENKGLSVSSERFSTITLWPIPESSTKYKLVYYKHRRMDDAGNEGTYTLDIPYIFSAAFTAALAFKLASKSKRPDIIVKAPAMKAVADQLFDEAAQNDRERADLRLVPRHYRI